MSTVDSDHRKAMDLASEALLQRREGRLEDAERLLAEALLLEKAAAHAIEHDMQGEPSRSVLHRSAAAMALQLGQTDEAERLICTALMGFPPPEIAEELRLIYDEIKFRRTWAERDVELEANEIEFRLDGPAIGPGVTPASLLMDRVAAAKKLLTRTAERQRQLPFRDKGRPKGGVVQELEMFLRPAAAGSFGLTLQIGAPREQLTLDGSGGVDEVIADTIDCLGLFSGGDEEELARRIPNEAYRRNFVALATQLEPDGRDVKVVALEAFAAGSYRRVALRRREAAPTADRRGRQRQPGWVELTGELQSATKSTQPGREGKIELLDQEGKKHRVIVLEGMSEVVKMYWDDKVTISGPRKMGHVYLERIARSEDG